MVDTFCKPFHEDFAEVGRNAVNHCHIEISAATSRRSTRVDLRIFWSFSLQGKKTIDVLPVP
jgi:hypothetical protein